MTEQANELTEEEKALLEADAAATAAAEKPKRGRKAAEAEVAPDTSPVAPADDETADNEKAAAEADEARVAAEEAAREAEVEAARLAAEEEARQAAEEIARVEAEEEAARLEAEAEAQQKAVQDDPGILPAQWEAEDRWGDTPVQMRG